MVGVTVRVYRKDGAGALESVEPALSKEDGA